MEDKMIFWVTRDEWGGMDAHFTEPKRHGEGLWYSDKNSECLATAWNKILCGKDRVSTRWAQKVELVEISAGTAAALKATSGKAHIIRFVKTEYAKLVNIEYYEELDKEFKVADFPNGNSWFGITADVQNTGEKRYFEIKVIHE